MPIPANQPCALELDALTRRFRSGEGWLTVLEEASLSVNEGETVAVIGPSGSGKTTLLGLCAGLDLPTSGRVSLLGTDITALTEDARAAFRSKHVGFVFQNFQLIPSLTALENVMAPLEMRGEGSAAPSASHLLDRVGLGQRQHHYPVQLSGGEQQRVALARAFINEPEILFADEPTGNLDGTNGGHIVELLFELNQSAGTTLILVTHDEALAGHCDRIVGLQNGRIVSDEYKR